MTCILSVLYSGSTGNATLLRCGDTAVLIDAGRSARALCRALCLAGVDPNGLSAIFLTHEHTDHTAALEVFLKHHPIPVHAAGGTAARLLAGGGAVAEHLVSHPPLFEQRVGPLLLSSFPTSHDSAGSVGYRITPDGGCPIGYATDLGTVTPAVEEALIGCERVVLECNHDEDMLFSGPYPYPLKQRIASRRGHLSNRDCAVFATRLAACGMRRLLLAHLSEINNTPDLALSEVRAALAGTAVSVSAASPDEITCL